MERGTSRINTPSKPLEISHRTLEENEDFENKLSQLKNQVDEMSGSMLKLVDLSSSQEFLKKEMEDQMKKKMDENKEEIQKDE
jgi:ABC-type Fe3+/spermidine/putrescine transport system ATPase subunit